MIQQKLTLDQAIAKGEEGMRAAAANAERQHTGWQDIAFSFVCKWAARRKVTDVFTAEDFVDEYVDDACFVQPPDDRAFGPVVKRAIANGIIGYVDTKGRRRKGNGSKCDRYRSLVVGRRWTEISIQVTR